VGRLIGIAAFATASALAIGALAAFWRS